MDLLHNGMLTDENFTTGLVIIFITHYIADFLFSPDGWLNLNLKKKKLVLHIVE
jgi:hypothetical protein